MNIQKKILLMQVICLCLVPFSSVVFAVEAFNDEFDSQATTEESWLILGTDYLFVNGCFGMASNGGTRTGLSLNGGIGQGDFQLVLKWRDVSMTSTTDARLEFGDQGGYSMLFRVLCDEDGSYSIDTSILGPAPWSESKKLPSFTDINFRVTWQDDPAAGRGGTWLMEYELDDSGYQTLVTVSSDLYLANADVDRSFRFWVSAVEGNAVIFADSFDITPLFQVSDCIPSDGETDVDAEIDPSWYSAPSALGSDVYFGTNQTDVDLATPLDPRGVYQSGTTSSPLVLGTLDLETTYYWRVDDIDLGTGNPAKGDVLSFITVNRYLEKMCADDFESYADSSALQAAWGGVSELALETVEVHSGSKAMSATASGSDLEIETQISPIEDWSSFKTVTVWCKGLQTNTALGAVLTLVVTDDNGNGLAQKTVYEKSLSEDWFPLTINVDSSDPDWAQVAKIGLKIGSVGTGEVAKFYFDDICMVYDCASSPNRIAADQDGNCNSNMTDLELLGSRWLDCGYVDQSLCQ